MLRSLITACAVAMAALGVFSVPHALAQDTPATVSPVIAGHSTADTDQGNVETERVDVRIKDASNLAAFEFILVFDSNLLKVESIEKGDFLGSSGREVFCLDPTIDATAVQYRCVTLGAEPAQGSDGAGTLASVTFSAKGKGKTNVELSHVRLSDPMANQLPSTVETASLEVFGSDSGRSWVFWVLVIGGAALAVAGLLALGGIFFTRRRRTVAAS